MWGDAAPSATGIHVTREKALSIPAVWRAVATVADTLASLHFCIFERTQNGSAPAVSHKLYNLIRLEPSPNQTAFNFRRALFLQACFGDAYAIIHRNGIGRAERLELLDARDVTQYQRDSGERFYVVRRTVGNRHSEEVYRPDEMLHVRGITLDGETGLDVVGIHRDNFGMGIAATRYGAAFFGNGAHMDKALVYPGNMTDQNRANAEAAIKKKSGVDNTGKTWLLDGGVKIEQFGIDPQKATLTESRRFQADESARIFGVPAHLIGQLDRATFNNIEVMNTQFVTLCLRPWAIQAEQEFAVKLLTREEKTSDRLFFRFNLDGLLRGATKDRAEYYRAALGGPGSGSGWMTPEEIRELENLNLAPDHGELFDVADAMQPQEVEEPQTDEPQTENDDDNGTPQASA